jgi:hypothetical protein
MKFKHKNEILNLKNEILNIKNEIFNIKNEILNLKKVNFLIKVKFKHKKKF